TVCTGRACCRRPAAVITAFLIFTCRPPAPPVVPDTAGTIRRAPICAAGSVGRRHPRSTEETTQRGGGLGEQVPTRRGGRPMLRRSGPLRAAAPGPRPATAVAAQNQPPRALRPESPLPKQTVLPAPTRAPRIDTRPLLLLPLLLLLLLLLGEGT